MKYFSLVLFVLVVSPLFAQFSGGDGSPESPYEIRTLQELKNVSLYPDKHFILKRNIRDSLRKPLCSPQSPFTGSFNGNGYKITMAIENPPNSLYFGLFEEIGNICYTYIFEIIAKTVKI